MKKALIITLVVVLVLFGAWLTYYLYKKSLINKILYNCQTNCENRRKDLMKKSIAELKTMIQNVGYIAENVFDYLPFKTK